MYVSARVHVWGIQSRSVYVCLRPLAAAAAAAAVFDGGGGDDNAVGGAGGCFRITRSASSPEDMCTGALQTRIRFTKEPVTDKLERLLTKYYKTSAQVLISYAHPQT